MSGVTVVFVAVVGARFLLPLAIPRWPLPAIIACLVLDGVDQTIFQLFGYDPPGYQSYDKSMDVYYLAIAYLAMMRNWRQVSAFGIGQFLYYYRLVGVLAFELIGARALLLLFPNTFEYYFIAYETVRTRWSPLRLARRWWLVCAALIWVVVKLPQEYWIHVAQLDLTDTLRDHWWAPPLLAGLLLVLGLVLWFVVRPRLPEPDHGWRWEADPLPEVMDSAAERAAWHAEHGRVWSRATLEKVVLMGLLAVIFSQTLPGNHGTTTELFSGVALVVVVNAALTLAFARRAWTIESSVMVFLVRAVLNVVMVVVAEAVLGGRDVNGSGTLFFLVLISLVTTLHDRWLPVLAVRREEAAERADGARDAAA